MLIWVFPEYSDTFGSISHATFLFLPHFDTFRDLLLNSTGQEGIYFFNWHKIPSDTGVETVDVSLTQSLPLLDFYTKNTANSQGPMEKERSPKAFCAILWNLHLEKVSKWQQEIEFTCKLSY